ncbi:glutamyl-tRNA(Gln) amidotransferase, B subunit [Methanoregula boonei 6A8]|jgi:aspartyl-tRNA(Asn)/glutamyl-tRNA(Gln) amidotransferase subunit B|uniref:Aspartyl/glutamyl-tRNA(Asn/Gln) amidotransferase subunit B n=1 Tax=Methanoregula boonei (strain DSM 21154 / JCM 14090 / 6A8) TaxID=456442 RepID=GATB_METB6|nr:Asp-tRNA(Asn)/Glu-tRNA(Gln) amidotransferase subunit GatB [Methanoregula boonei]A7I6L5.1 RecName: Full=Aspartyl/glutamyl-tRNA(Asn/Gln) amidotransferase subunit B; Short=Asp/Glu-ADT subunit B [Methanoregula boonei 6A8]ABS55376.1 glutamyl-tRNA(Gln) amidotransferase, B subunit [Methanoregula boonei 6A8]
MIDADVIVGLEVHCQLDTKSKLFCGCSTDYRDDGPNTHVCPICLGLPGTMPALNKRAIEYAMKVAKALNCTIVPESEFSRKNYFYPDLDKAYQITQYDKPLAQGGYVEIEGDDGKERKIQLTRIHVEEDPGRLVHMGNAERGRYSLVDYNRAGIPLIEIVSEPDMRSPKEARKFLNKLRATLEYLGVFDSEKEGSLRVDANISLRGNERVEVKNITSYKGVEKALTFEVTRQKNLIRRGLPVERETRHYLEARGITQSARSKETENDYRYFPEPDLRPLRVQSWVKDIALPELPDARRERFVTQYSCSLNHARTLTGELKMANFFEGVVSGDRAGLCSLAATWIADTLAGELNYRNMGIDCVDPHRFGSLLAILRAGTITDKSGVEVLRVMLDEQLKGETVETPEAIVARLNLAKTAGDDGALAAAVKEVISENPKAIEDYKAGKNGAINFLVGQVMKKTRGRADPGELNRLVVAALKDGGQ